MSKEAVKKRSPQDDKNGNSSSAVPKKPRIEQEDSEFSEAELATMWTKAQMQTLARNWNMLGSPQEQEDYLSDMKLILKTGSCSYCNPFGEDDREGFGTTFENELNAQEQQHFVTLATKLLKENKAIQMSDIRDFLIHGPFLPVHVSLRKKRSKV